MNQWFIYRTKSRLPVKGHAETDRRNPNLLLSNWPRCEINEATSYVWCPKRSGTTPSHPEQDRETGQRR
jgi:hypothetical protein